MAEREDLTGPEMGCRTGFHRNDTRMQLRKESMELTSRQLLATNNAPIRSRAMNLKNPLG